MRCYDRTDGGTINSVCQSTRQDGLFELGKWVAETHSVTGPQRRKNQWHLAIANESFTDMGLQLDSKRWPGFGQIKREAFWARLTIWIKAWRLLWRIVNCWHEPWESQNNATKWAVREGLVRIGRIKKKALRLQLRDSRVKLWGHIPELQNNYQNNLLLICSFGIPVASRAWG